MKNYFKYPSLLFLLALIIFVSPSCRKFLDVKSDKSLNVPTSISDMQAILDNTVRMNLYVTPALGTSSSDEFFITPDVYNSFEETSRDIYKWQLKDYFHPNDWSAGYLPVYLSNLCLEQIEKIIPTSKNLQDWNNVKGSALFYRSYNFLNLVWNYSQAYDSLTSPTDLGIVLRLISDNNVPYPRATVSECYEKIIHDSKVAMNLLPNEPLHVMRPSKAAAYGLLARTYLSMRKYDSAYKYSDLSLSIKNKLIDYNNDDDINENIENTVPFKRFNKETIFYSDMTTDYLICNVYDAFVDLSIYNSFDENDLRKIAYFSLDTNYPVFKCIYSSNNSTFFTGIAIDEMFLIRSETSIRLNKITEGIRDLNTLLAARWKAGTYTPISETDPAIALDIVLNERRKSLLFRGLRWIDIKRLIKENRNIELERTIEGKSFYLKPFSSYFALPLPKDLMENSQIEQNP